MAELHVFNTHVKFCANQMLFIIHYKFIFYT